jgi:hypothetical protein
MRQRLQSFFYSRRNLAGMALALGGLTLYAVGILGAPAWIPITVGLYAVGYLLVPDHSELRVRLDAAQDASELREGLEQLLRRIRGKVADDLYAKAWHIRESILATLEVEGAENETDPNVYLIRQTALSYLPEAFATYLRMPRLMAERRAIANGRTPHDVLLEQLDLMDRRLKDVADDIARHDSDKLLANGRFLAEKFGTSTFDIGAVDATASTATSSVSEPTAEAARVSQPAPAEPIEADAKVEERERVH